MTAAPNAKDWMRQAIQLASQAAKFNEVPVGAVIVNAHGKLLAETHNLMRHGQDATMHAELLAIRAATSQTGSARLVDCDLYVTLEPCAMCAAAISHARLRRLYFAAYDVKGGAVDHGIRWFEQDTCFHRPEIIGGLLETEASQQLNHFFAKLRQ